MNYSNRNIKASMFFKMSVYKFIAILIRRKLTLTSYMHLPQLHAYTTHKLTSYMAYTISDYHKYINRTFYSDCSIRVYRPLISQLQ